ncbi:hypothetical protein [Mycobacterium sp. GA-2829]|uniref:hypothetical protein n=1 Tax=Mycobacterium sp. GA-2829 TaxID=1772283 RepID=UPI0007400981|nr:hypothetical protein [Mycobacterium sp. GA-2829]KUI39792.1 hypothetical protein AU194_24205 [Mycobacterium sp. GA-2829]
MDLAKADGELRSQQTPLPAIESLSAVEGGSMHQCAAEALEGSSAASNIGKAWVSDGTEQVYAEV